MGSPSAHAISQYATTDQLSARIAIHAFGTNPQDWFSWLGERLPSSGRTLEVGAGTGALWSRVPAPAGLTLTDFSPAMCDRLRTVPGATVRRCDAAALPFIDGAFDAVIANHMLYHLDDPEAALAEFARVLRPGGQVLIALNGADHMAELNAIGPAAGRPDLHLAAGQNDLTADTAPQRIARYFSGVTVERYFCDLEIPAVAPVLAYLDSLTDPPLCAPERLAARQFVQAEIDTAGTFHIGKHTVLITARAG